MNMDSNIPAFISPGSFELDGISLPGVITAELLEDGHLQITIRPIGSLTFNIGNLQVVIDDQDLRSVNALLRTAADDEADEALDELLEIADDTPSPS